MPRSLASLCLCVSLAACGFVDETVFAPPADAHSAGPDGGLRGNLPAADASPPDASDLPGPADTPGTLDASSPNDGSTTDAVAGPDAAVTPGDGGVLPSAIDQCVPGTGPLPEPPAVPCQPKCPAAPKCASDNGCGMPCPKTCPVPGTGCQQGQCVSCGCGGLGCKINACGQTCSGCGDLTTCGSTGKCVDPCAGCAGWACATYDFEDGLNGWQAKGDVAAVERFGQTPAWQGQRMLRLSTGLGGPSSSEARRVVCVPNGATRIRWVWRYYSEEFLEWCDSGMYQDAFTVQLEDAFSPQTFTAVDVRPEQFCSKKAESNGCGGLALLTPSDVSFDQGDVHRTPWLQTTRKLPLTLKKAALVLKVADSYDEVYDTVVLVDRIEFLP